MFHKNENNQWWVLPDGSKIPLLDKAILQNLESASSGTAIETNPGIRAYHFLNDAFETHGFLSSAYHSADGAIQALENLEGILAIPALLNRSFAKDQIIQAVAQLILNHVENVLPENISIDDTGNPVISKGQQRQIATSRFNMILQFRNYIKTSIASLHKKFPAVSPEKEAVEMTETEKEIHTVFEGIDEAIRRRFTDAQLTLLSDFISQSFDMILESEKLDTGTLILFLERTIDLQTDENTFKNLLDKLYEAFPEKSTVAINIIRALKTFHDLYHNNLVTITIPYQRPTQTPALNWWMQRIGRPVGAEVQPPEPAHFQLVTGKLINRKIQQIKTASVNAGRENEIASEKENRISLEATTAGNQEWREIIHVSFPEAIDEIRYDALAEYLRIPVENMPPVLNEEILDCIFTYIEKVDYYINIAEIPQREFFIQIAGIHDHNILILLLREAENVVKLMKEASVPFSEIAGVNDQYILPWLNDCTREIITLITEGHISFSEMANVHRDGFWGLAFSNVKAVVRLKNEGGVSFQELSVIDDNKVLYFLLEDAEHVLMLMKAGISFQQLSGIPDHNIVDWLLKQAKEVLLLMNEAPVSFSEIAGVNDHHIFLWFRHCIRAIITLAQSGYVSFSELANFENNDIWSVLFSHAKEAIQLKDEGGISFQVLSALHDEDVLYVLLKNAKNVVLLIKAGISFKDLSDVNKEKSEESLEVLLENPDQTLILMEKTGVSFQQLSTIDDVEILKVLLDHANQAAILMKKTAVSLQELADVDDENVLKAIFKYPEYNAEKIVILMSERHLSFPDIANSHPGFDFSSGPAPKEQETTQNRKRNAEKAEMNINDESPKRQKSEPEYSSSSSTSQAAPAEQDAGQTGQTLDQVSVPDQSTLDFMNNAANELMEFINTETLIHIPQTLSFLGQNSFPSFTSDQTHDQDDHQDDLSPMSPNPWQ